MAVYYPQARINISAVFDGFGGPDAPAILPNILPQSFNVHLNSYKEADTWEVSFNSKWFPFSPELIRSAAVEIYCFQAPDAVTPVNWNTEENLLVTGLVDNATLSQADGGVVSLDGRDYTALLIDRQWDPEESGSKGRIPVGMPLDECVQKLVDEAVQAERVGRTLTVVFIDKVVNPRSGRLEPGPTKPPPVVGHGKQKKNRGIPVNDASTYWDVIYKLCMSFGFIVYVQGFRVIITKPHVLQAASADEIHRVAYGRNLASLEMERKLAKDSVPQIRVRSYDPKHKRAIEGRFPSDKDADFEVTGKKKKTRKEEYKVFTVPDVANEATLKEIAKTTYHTLARGEGLIRFRTKALTDLGGRDLTRLRSGDPVAIEWDAFNAEIMLDPKIAAAAKAARIVALGYSPQVATIVSEQFDKLNYFRQPFYVKEVNFTWDSAQGLQLDVEAMNYINATRDGQIDG